MLKRLMQSSFVKFTSTVFLGNVVSQLIIFLAFALFAHFFTKNELGIYTVFISISVVLSILATGRYELAIMLPKKNEEASLLLSAALILAFIFSVFVFAVLFVSPFSFTSFPGIASYTLWLPLGIFFMSAYQSGILFNNRLQKYQRNAFLRLLQALLMLSLSFLLTYIYDFTALSLIMAWVLSQAVVFSINIAFYRSYFSFFSIARLKEMMHDYKRYPSIALAGNFIDTLSVELPNYIIPVYFGVSTQALYAYANKVAAAPRNFIASAVGEVFFNSSSKLAHDNPELLIVHLKKVSKGLFLLSTAIYGIAILGSAYVFPLVFGASFAPAVPFFNWIAFASIFLFVQQPISTIDDVVNKLKPTLIYNVVSLVIKAATLISTAIYFQSPLHTIAIYSIVNALLSFFWINYLHKMAKNFHPLPA